MKIVGTVLAGGLSTRMNGPEKTLLAIGNTPLIERVVGRFAEQIAPLIISANGDPARFDWLKLPVISDTIEGFAGPLAGVLASMRWATEHTNAEAVLSVAADTPFFPLNYSQKMLENAQPDTIRLANSNNRRHPVFGLWPVGLADQLEEFLAAGDRKVMMFVEQYANELIEFPCADVDPFFNVNSPDDLIKAKTILEKQS